MTLTSVKTGLCWAFTLSMLASCSNSSDVPQMDQQDDAVREFTPEEKRAAKSLSIGNGGAIEIAGSPSEQAMRCKIAIEGLSVRFQQSGALSDEQMQALEKAQLIYEEKSRSLEAARNDQASEGDTSAGNADVEPLGEAASVQVAIGCLRKLDGAI